MSVVRESRWIRTAEEMASAATILASIALSVLSERAPFLLLFVTYALASSVFTTTMYIKKQWPMFRLQLFFVVLNTFASINYVITH